MCPAGTEGGGHLRLIPGILLAAGAASRFGRPKLLEQWQGVTLVRRAASTLWDAGIRPLIAVVPAGAEFADQLMGLTSALVVNANPEQGIGQSIALGMGAIQQDAPAVMIAVADQPLLSIEAIRSLLTAFQPGAIVTPLYGGHPGNPRIFDRRFFSELASLEGDRGGQLVAQAHAEAVVEIELPEPLGIDVDQPSDWARLTEASGSGD